MYEYSGRALVFGASGGIGQAFSRFLENKLGSENVVKISRSFDAVSYTHLTLPTRLPV